MRYAAALLFGLTLGLASRAAEPEPVPDEPAIPEVASGDKATAMRSFENQARLDCMARYNFAANEILASRCNDNLTQVYVTAIRTRTKSRHEFRYTIVFDPARRALVLRTPPTPLN